MNAWMRTQSLPKLFLVSAGIVLVPCAVVLSAFTLVFEHHQVTLFVMSVIIYGTLQSATVITLGEHVRRRRRVAAERAVFGARRPRSR